MQQRQSTQPPSEQRSPCELAAARRLRAARLLAGTAATTLLALLASGCPEAADLANPGMYDAPAAAGTSSGTAGSSGSGSTDSMCEVACIKKIFQESTALCTPCHNTNLKYSQLDLTTVGFTARLKNQPAQHLEIAPPPTSGDCPTGDKLIDVDDPSKSWLLTKVKGQQKTCGTQMPVSGPLGAMDMSCVETYVYCVAGKPPPGGGSSGGSGGSGTAGTGGSSTSGSGGTGGN